MSTGPHSSITRCERHGEIGCAWCTPFPEDMNEFYTEQVTYTEIYWSAGQPKPIFPGPWRIALPPTGWLTAIMVDKRVNCDDFTMELSDSDRCALFNSIVVPCQLNKVGTRFDPIPNLNASCPYYLLVPSHIEGPLKIILVSQVAR